MKILAEINNKPLLRGTKLKYNDQEIWVEFRYENMVTLYFYCGLVGHLKRNCEHANGML